MKRSKRQPQKANIHDFIVGPHNMIPRWERGASGFGRQTAISIALYSKNPPILLLDEATSALIMKRNKDSTCLGAVVYGRTSSLLPTGCPQLRMRTDIGADRGRGCRTGTHELMMKMDLFQAVSAAV